MSDPRQLFRVLVEARALEETIGEHAAFYHSGFGMEAVGTGTCTCLRPDDFLVAHYRGVAAPLAKGMDPADLLRGFLLKQTSPVHGRTWHPVDVGRGIFGHQGTSGSEFGRAAGLALAARRRGEGALAVAMFGDGSAQRGTMHEAFLMASSWELPVLWVCENNGWMISTRAERIFPGEIADIAGGYRMQVETVDGNDVVAVDEAASRLTEHVRAEQRPAFLEARTYRVRSHTEIEEAPYQDRDEIEQWRRRDPLVVARERLAVAGIAAEELDRIEAEGRARIAAAFETVSTEPGHDPTEDVETFLYASAPEGS